MLAVEKENLLAETNREIAQLRETELRYYIDHIGAIQTMATLLAGFAFTALVQSNTLNLDEHTVLFRELTHSLSLDQNETMATGDIITPVHSQIIDPWKFFSFFMHAGELTSVVFCLGEMLHAITESLIARLLGARLALRGPDGSIIRATRHLSHSLASTTRTFFRGLQFFILSVAFYALRGQHPAVAGWLIMVLYFYWRGQGHLTGRLSIDFYLSSGVTTAFVGDDPIFERDALKPGQAQNLGYWRGLVNFLNPVGHRLKFLVDEVSHDFMVPGRDEDSQHRNPAAATQHLIMRTESRQRQASVADLDSGLDEPRFDELALAAGRELKGVTNAWGSVKAWTSSLLRPRSSSDGGAGTSNKVHAPDLNGASYKNRARSGSFYGNAPSFVRGRKRGHAIANQPYATRADASRMNDDDTDGTHVHSSKLAYSGDTHAVFQRVTQQHAHFAKDIDNLAV